jgi:hypothetical protein
MELPNLPPTNDDFWEGEKYASKNIKLSICETHTKKNWMDHIGYRDNHDGTASCIYCGWGFNIPGYLRVFDDKVFDLRQG